MFSRRKIYTLPAIEILDHVGHKRCSTSYQREDTGAILNISAIYDIVFDVRKCQHSPCKFRLPSLRIINIWINTVPFTRNFICINFICNSENFAEFASYFYVILT